MLARQRVRGPFSFSLSSLVEPILASVRSGYIVVRKARLGKIFLFSPRTDAYIDMGDLTSYFKKVPSKKNEPGKKKVPNKQDKNDFQVCLH
ncbi:hypothetical protein BJV82DRAFT_616284 [Fennellomyces sp. T-0311]|nr:hypothetical protein BJV82DRAFT_616284 [Fennellomyces sp. T-0311]